MKKNFIFIPLYFGKIENLVNRTTLQIAKEFNLKRNAQWNPHITLFGPFKLKHGHRYSEVYEAIERNATGFDKFSYSIKGLKVLDSPTLGYVLAYEVKLNPDLEKYYMALTQDLLKFVNAPKWEDRNQKPEHLHISILYHMSNNKKQAVSICHQLEKRSSIKPILTDLFVPRIYFRNGAYDIPRKKWFEGNELWDKYEWQNTFKNMI